MLEKIFIYPVKSLGGIERRKVQLCEEGLLWDRSWMLVDDDGVFITQRQFPSLNLLKIQELEDEFMVTDPNNNFLLIPKEMKDKKNKILFHVKIWESEFDAEIWDPYASQWLSTYLDQRVILVKMIDKNRIKKSSVWESEFPVQFTDGYPIHIVNINSVKKVSEWSNEEIHYSQFRPNFLINNLVEFEEEKIKSFFINDQKFLIIKPTERCIMSTIKPDDMRINKQPLAAIAQNRKEANKVNFGIYAIPHRHSEEENFSIIEVNQKLQIEFI